MLYRIPSELYYEPDSLIEEARIVTATANVLKNWIYDKPATVLQYLNTGDSDIKRAILGEIIKIGRGHFNPHIVIDTLDKVMEDYMQHDDEQEQPDEYKRLANTPWHYDEPDAKPKDDTVAEGIPHRTHDTNIPWSDDRGLFRPCCQADD